MKKAIGNGLVGLAALVATGCSTIPTNTQPLVNSPTKYSGYNFKVDGQKIGNETFHYKPLPAEKTFKINGQIIPRSSLANSYGINSGKDMKVRIENGGATYTTEVPYALVNVAAENGQITPNTNDTLAITEVTYSTKPFSSKTKTKGTISRERLEKKSEKFEGLWIGNEYFQRARSSVEDMSERTVENSTPYTFFRNGKGFAEMVVKNGKTNIVHGLKVEQYIQVPGEIVDIPQPIQPEVIETIPVVEQKQKERSVTTRN